MIAFSNEVGFVAFNRTICPTFDVKNSFIANYILMGAIEALKTKCRSKEEQQIPYSKPFANWDLNNLCVAC